MNPGARAEIEIAVTEALAATGIHGRALVGGKTMELHGAGPPVAVEIGEAIEQWPLLPPDMRRRKAHDIALRLAESYRQSRALAAEPEDPDAGSRRKLFVGIAAFMGLLAVVGLIRVAIPRLRSEPPKPPALGEENGERKARLGRACAAGRAKIYGGAGFGPIALEGWVAELWLVGNKGKDLGQSPAVTGLVAGKKLSPAADEELAKISDGTLEVADALPGELAAKSPGWSGTTIRFGEGYARAFLLPDTRPRLLALADRVYETSGATLGAFYARCADLPTHDVGAWFKGPDAGGAAAALVYSMGWFAEARVVDRGALAQLAPANELAALLKAGEKADAFALAGVVSAEGAGVSSAGGTSFTFPVGAPTRAITATRAAAAKLGIGIRTD